VKKIPKYTHVNRRNDKRHYHLSKDEILEFCQGGMDRVEKLKTQTIKEDKMLELTKEEIEKINKDRLEDCLAGGFKKVEFIETRKMLIHPTNWADGLPFHDPYATGEEAENYHISFEDIEKIIELERPTEKWKGFTIEKHEIPCSNTEIVSLLAKEEDGGRLNIVAIFSWGGSASYTYKGEYMVCWGEAK